MIYIPSRERWGKTKITVAKSKRSSDANTAGELKTAAETAVTDYLTSVDAINSPDNAADVTITFSSATMASGYGDGTLDNYFQQAAGSKEIKSKVHPSENFNVIVVVKPGDVASYDVKYSGASSGEDIFANGTK